MSNGGNFKMITMRCWVGEVTVSSGLLFLLGGWANERNYECVKEKRKLRVSSVSAQTAIGSLSNS